MIEKITKHKLNAFFNKDKIDFNDLYDTPTNYSLVCSFEGFENKFIINEFKWWLQNMRNNFNLSGSTLNGYCRSLKTLFSFLDEYYPDIKTITEIDHKKLVNEYSDYLVSIGKSLKKPLSVKNHIGADMEYKEYFAKSDSLYDLDKYYKFVFDFYYPVAVPENEKDIWDIRKLGVPYNILPSRPRYTINYSKILQPTLKQAIKEYNLLRLPKQSISTILDDMKAFNLLSECLNENKIELTVISDIDRAVIKVYLRFLRQKQFETTTFNRRVSAIKTFLELGYALDLNGFPSICPVNNTDFVKRKKKLPVPFSDNELKKINKHIDKLQYPYSNVLFIIERHGLRMSDICSATIIVDGKYCIRKIGKDNNLFTYNQIKTHKTNTICIDDLNAEIIESSIEHSKNTFGENAKYIFSKDIDKPIGEESFVSALNKMCKENDIRSDDGKLLRVKGHTFRRTLATDYANMGIDMNVIKSLLGQEKLDVLTHYIKIHSEEMAKFMEPVTQENYDLIDSIGNEQKLTVEEEKYAGSYIPLSCGYCSKDVKSGICEHANACYSCTMFKPIKSLLPLYRKQLSDVENNIFVCNINGYQRLLENSMLLKERLIDIINKLESEEQSENGQNYRIIS